MKPIWIVDDDQSIRFVLEKALLRENLPTRSFTNATDVLKALALGARAVRVGRPPLWGLALGGADGARRVLELLRDELDLAMALSGCRSVAEITSDLVAPLT